KLHATPTAYVCIVSHPQSFDIPQRRERGFAPRLLGARRSLAGLRGISMISISSRSRLVAAASPFAVAIALASTPAWAQETPAVTGAASAATAAQDQPAPATQGD